MLPSEKIKQLKKLQEENQKIISTIKTIHRYYKRITDIQKEMVNLDDLNYRKRKDKIKELDYQIKENIINNKKIIKNQKEMANLNKLDDSEKNIHAIWIGIPPKGEFDNLKVWAKFNPEYKIHIWTDSNHILSHKLENIISENAKKLSNDLEEYNYQLEAILKDEFYYNYQLKNPEKTFDENAKQFLLDKKYASETKITNLIKEGQERIIKEQKDIKNYTNNQVILHDIVKEKDNIFPTKKYDDGYLKTLEHLHICAGASDRLRYAILNKFGGVYLDTDLMTNFNLENLTNNQSINNLIDSVQWNNIYNGQDLSNQKFELIINQMITLDCLNQLNNDTKIKIFSKDWENIFSGDFEKNQQIFQEIAKEFKSLNLKLEPEMKLSNFPINNSLQSTYLRNDTALCNAFIINKENSEFLQEVMKKIETIDEKLKNMSTSKKLINKSQMIIHHTGPGNINYSIEETDDDFYFSSCNQPKIANLNTLNSIASSWFVPYLHKHAFKNPLELKSLFWANKNETKKYFNDLDLQLKKMQDLNIKEEPEEERE